MAVAPSHHDDAPHVVELLYREHAIALRAYCRRQVGAADADEIVQTTFLRALRALNRGERPYAERAWLITIARNVCASRATSAARRHELLDLRAVEGAAVGAPHETADSDLASALQSLPEGQRRAFVLRAVHELSYDEIAAELGVSRAAVETWIFRARRKLAGAIGDRRRRRLALDLSSVAGVAKSLFAGSAVKVAAATVVAGTTLAVGPASPEVTEQVATPQARTPQQAGALPIERTHTASVKPAPDRSRPTAPTAVAETPERVPPTSAETPTAVSMPRVPEPEPAPAQSASAEPPQAASPPEPEAAAPEAPLVELPAPEPLLPALELPKVEVQLSPLVPGLDPTAVLPLLP